MMNKRFANYQDGAVTDGRNILRIDDIISAFPMGDQSNDVLIVQQHEIDGVRDIYSWAF